MKQKPNQNELKTKVKQIGNNSYLMWCDAQGRNNPKRFPNLEHVQNSKQFPETSRFGLFPEFVF
jgi:hypothetical protein